MPFVLLDNLLTKYVEPASRSDPKKVEKLEKKSQGRSLLSQGLIFRGTVGMPFVLLTCCTTDQNVHDCDHLKRQHGDFTEADHPVLYDIV